MLFGFEGSPPNPVRSRSSFNGNPYANPFDSVFCADTSMVVIYLIRLLRLPDSEGSAFEPVTFQTSPANAKINCDFWWQGFIDVWVLSRIDHYVRSLPALKLEPA